MFHGSMVALVTPMLGDGAIDEDSLQRLVDFHVEEPHGCHCVGWHDRGVRDPG